MNKSIDDKITFVHIPKTGGIGLKNVLSNYI